MQDPRPPVRPAPVLARELSIPRLHLARAEGATDVAELAAQILTLKPASVAVPTRHGATVAELYDALRESDPVPRLIAASTKLGNPIVWSLARGEDHCEDLDEREVFSSEVGGPLATRHANHGDAAIAAVRATQGWGYAAGDAELLALAKQIQRAESLDVAPAACAGVAALHFAAKLERLERHSPHVALVYVRVG